MAIPHMARVEAITTSTIMLERGADRRKILKSGLGLRQIDNLLGLRVRRKRRANSSANQRP